MRLNSIYIALLLMVCSSILVNLKIEAQDNPFLGKWDITGVGQFQDRVYWLEVKIEDGKLAGYFLNRGGSVTKLPQIAIENGELVFSPSTTPGQSVHRAKV